MKKRTKIIIAIFFTVVILLVLLFGMLHTAFFRNYLVSKLIDELNKKIEGKITVGTIEGNLWRKISLREIVIVQKSDTLALIPSFEISYRPWRVFLKEIALDSLVISGISVNLFQDDQANWNVLNILKGKANTDTNKVKTTSRFLFTIKGKRIVIQDMTIVLNSVNRVIPKRIKHLNLSAEVGYGEKYQLLNIKRFSFESEEPGFRLDTLSFNFKKQGEKASLTDFKLKSRYNDIDGGLTLENSRSDITLHSDAMEFSEFNLFLPEIDIIAAPIVFLNTVFFNDSLKIVAGFTMQEQSLQIEARLKNYSALFGKAVNDPYIYQVALKCENLNLQDWLASFPYPTNINGNIKTIGSGNPLKSGSFNSEMTFINSQFMQITFDSLYSKTTALNNSILSSGYLAGKFGLGRYDLEVNILDKNQLFQTKIDFEKLNLVEFLKKSDLNSDLNFTVNAGGERCSWKDLKADITMTCTSSDINKIHIDSLFINASFEKGMMTLSTLTCISALGVLKLEGEGDLYQQNRLRYTLTTNDLSPIKPFTALDTLRAAGLMRGEITGSIDSLEGRSSLVMQRIYLNSYSSDSLTGNWIFAFKENRFSAMGNLTLLNFQSNEINFNRLDFEGKLSSGIIETHLEGNQGDSIDFVLESVFSFHEVQELRISNLEVHLPGNFLHGGSDKMGLVFGKNNIRFEDCNLKAYNNKTNTISSLSLEGTISADSTQNFKCRLENFNLAYISGIFNLPLFVDGQATVAIDLMGTGQSPQIDGRLRIENAIIDRYAITEIDAVIDYHEQEFTCNTSIKIDSMSHMICEAQIPIDLSLSDFTNNLRPGKGSKIHCYTDGIPLSVLNYEELNGTFTCDITLIDLFDTPEYLGVIQVDNGVIRIPEYGLLYEKIRMHLSAENNRIDLDELQAKTGVGQVVVQGFMEFSKTDSLELSAMEFEIGANKFIPLQSKDVEVLVSGSSWIKLIDGIPEFGGRLDVSRLVLNVPALTAADQKKKAMNLPLLVSLLAVQSDSLIETAESNENDIKRLVDSIIEDFQGSVKVYIPRNFWLLNPGMRIELYGDLDLAKTGPHFEIFGEIKTLRGHFDFLARRFQIGEGSIYFQGGEKVNPILDINAVYTFRTIEREKKSLQLAITDKLSDIKFKYTLDNQVIDETEAISYLLFGQSMNTSSGSQQSVVSDQANIIAMNMASQILSQQLAKSVGDPLALDYIEIKATDNWRNASFVVGKYLTNDLYLSYQRNFGETSDSNTVPEIITMEYELTRRLFLQLMAGSEKTSGFDFIFKFEK
jgi:translocation and assembly module TamB